MHVCENWKKNNGMIQIYNLYKCPLNLDFSKLASLENWINFQSFISSDCDGPKIYAI